MSLDIPVNNVQSEYVPKIKNMLVKKTTKKPTPHIPSPDGPPP